MTESKTDRPGFDRRMSKDEINGCPIKRWTGPISVVRNRDQLTAAMRRLAGHTLLKVFAGFVISLGVIGGWLPLAFVVALSGLELLIAFLQAYVFTILTCLYINDALHMH